MSKPTKMLWEKKKKKKKNSIHMFGRHALLYVDAVGQDYFVTPRVQFIRIQEEQAKDGAGRENGHRT